MRVSPITLVIFVVLSVFSLVFAYVCYSNKGTQEAELESATTALTASENQVQGLVKDLNDLLLATGYNVNQMKEVTGSTEVGKPAQTLDDLLRNKLSARDDLVKKIGVQITDVDAQGHSTYLQSTIETNLAADATPAEMRGTLVGDIIDNLREADRKSKEHANVIAQGEAGVTALNTSIADKQAEIVNKLAEWDDQIKSAWAKRMAAREKLLADRKTWAAEEASLVAKLNADKAVLARMDARIAAQDDPASPAVGRVIAYDWRAKRGTINLGSHDGVKTGFQFDVFRRYPGPDTADRRINLAKITLVDVQPLISVFITVPSDLDKPGQQMAAGDLVTNKLFNATRAKRFYIAGYFPRGADYDRDGIAGLARKFGGTIQDKLTLDTDYVVVGVVDEGGMTDWSDDAKAAIAQAKADYELARRYDLAILTVDKFLALINRK